ncbi:CGNR zinc finger domain-containing protein [Nocardioides marinus]|nr:CGNR zinc finger domain-containing protein [Nocardioides marinus]
MSLQAAVELTNTTAGPDTLATVADLDAYYSGFEYTGRHERTRTELEEVRALRPRFRELFTASREDAVEIVNHMLAEAGAVPQLVRHDPYDWHIHACPPDAPLATRITVETAMAMVDVIRTDEMSRLGVCEDQDCDGIVLDLSRNRSKRFCSTTCGNRNAVAAYRARQAGEA